MPCYDFTCSKCEIVFEIEKSMAAPSPTKCPKCGKKGIERVYTAPNIAWPNRPPWTYSEAKKYKTARWNGGPLTKIDPSKHGDISSWNSPGEVVKEKPKGKKK